MEEAVGTRSRIFYKYEGVSPAGSHKPNTAVAQACYNKQEGRTRLATETGAGQWGSALSFACQLMGLECKVCMVRVSYVQGESSPRLASLPAPRGSSPHLSHRTRSMARSRPRPKPTRPARSRLSGHGHFDMAAYDNHFAGNLVDLKLEDEEIARALRAIEGLPVPA